jgi:hypothetical protein
MWGDEMEKTNVHLAGSQEYAPAAPLPSDDEAGRLLTDFTEWVCALEMQAMRVAGMLPGQWMAHEASDLRLQISAKKWALLRYSFYRAAPSGRASDAAKCSEQRPENASEAPEPNQPKQQTGEQS